jgi:hypothetical protein
MSFGFPAYSSSNRHFKLGKEELVSVIGEALGILGWRYESPSPNRFVARISIGLWSWGETLTAEVAFDGTVTARSECVLVTQCFDWGKNSSNVWSFFDKVSRIASERENHQQPLAPQGKGHVHVDAT